MGVPASSSTVDYLAIQDEVDEAIRRVLESGQYSLGEDVFAFEREFAAYCGADLGISVHSGSAAILLTLLALGIGPGDQVIVAVNSCCSVANAILASGAEIVLVDIDADTYNVDPARLEESLTTKIGAIVAVHALGRPCDVQAIKQIAEPHGVAVVEDAAVAIGAEIWDRRVGSFGDANVFSFGPGKILTGCGSGGMVLTNNPAIAERVRVLSRYGTRVVRNGEVKREYEKRGGRVCAVEGYNSQLDSIQAAVLRIKLTRLDRQLEQRREKAALYRQLLAGLGVVLPVEQNGLRSVHWHYPIRVKDRDRVLQDLNDRGIEATVYHLPPLHMQPGLRHLGYREGDFPVTEEVSRGVIYLPFYPELTGEQIKEVVVALADCIAPRDP